LLEVCLYPIWLKKGGDGMDESRKGDRVSLL